MAVWAGVRNRLEGRSLSVALAIYGLTFAVLIVAQWFSDETRSIIANAWYLPIGVLSAIIAWRLTAAPAMPRRQRIAWRLIAITAVASFSSDAMWIYVENIRGEDPSTNLVANTGYLLYYPILLASLLLLPQALRSRRDAMKFGLDVATVVVAGTMVVWHLVIAPLVATNDPSRVAFTVALAYPVGDLLVLLGLTTVLMRYPRGPRRGPLLLLATSIGAAMVADILWAHLALTGSFEAGHIQDLPYMVQYALFAMSIAEERRRLAKGGTHEDDQSPGSVTVLPYAAVFVGYIILINVTWRQLSGDMLPVVAGAVLLTVLVVARQLVALNENARLMHDRALVTSERRFKSLIQNASDVVSIIDTDWKLRFASPSAEQTFGYSTSSLVGRRVVDLIHPDDAGDAIRRLKQLLADPTQAFSARWRLRRSNGEWVETENTARNLMADENIRGLVLTTRDVSERVSLEAELLHNAHHDPVTGLANRMLFQDRVEAAIARGRKANDVVGVLFIDLDRFKGINDSHGHALGDATLRAAAQRLVAGLRSIDLAARIGGDEFAVLLDERGGPVDATAVGERIAHVFHAPLRVEGRDLTVTVSVGVATSTDGLAAAELLRNADLAMYLAKSRGRGQAATFEPSMHAALLHRLELRSELHTALADNQFALVYQPVHALDTQALVGAEALMRWIHPAHGVIMPDVFIPIAEETGLIVTMGRWALGQACRDARRWDKVAGGLGQLVLSVNLSGRQIAAPGLVTDVQAALRTSGLTPARLVLELTESILLERTSETMAVMEQLKRTGVRLAIDDFGTGYSSLSYLQRLPIDVLKIDRTFVEGIVNERSADAVTRAIVALAATMSLRTVAEGVETQQQLDHLRLIGCAYAQGYFFSRPMPSADFEAYVEGYAVRACRRRTDDTFDTVVAQPA